MPRNMRHITCDMVRELINSNPNPQFDNHWIEMRVLRDHTVAFATELLEYRTKQDPLMEFSRELSHWVGRKFKAHLTKPPIGRRRNGKVESRNLAGDDIPNQLWEKRTPGTPIPPSACT
jgi:hypothetical protein